MRVQECVALVLMLGCLVDNVISTGDTVLYWSASQTTGSQSCLYSLEGSPVTWVSHLTLGGEVWPNPLCVDQSIIKLGPLASNMYGTYEVYSADGGQGGLVNFEAFHEGEAQTIPAIGARNVKGVAYDWLSEALYFTDTDLGVGIAGRDRSHSKILFGDVANPLGIVVDPNAGYFFYVESDLGRIWRATLNGDSMASIVDNLSTEGDLLIALDGAAETLYILDQTAATLSSVSYDGTALTVVRTFQSMTPGEVAGLAICEDYVFLLLTEQSNMWILNKATGEDVITMVFPDVTGVTYHGLSFAAQNDSAESTGCSVDNGGCQQICVHKPPTSSQCLCSWGYELDADGVSCTSSFTFDNFILVSDIRTGKLYHLSTQTGEVQGIPFDESNSPLLLQGVTYDSGDNMLYWVDTGRQMLLRQAMAHDVVSEVVYTFTEASNVESIVLDKDGNYIYYSDSGLHLIGRISLSNFQQQTILGLTPSEYPLRIQLDTGNQAIYWTNVGNPATIERANMEDGTMRTSLVSTGLSYPSGLAVDFKEGRMYWADWQLGKVESIDVRSTEIGDRKQFASVEDCYAVTLDNQYIYIATSHEIKRYTRDAAPQAALGLPLYSVIYDVSLTSATLPTTMTYGSTGGGSTITLSVVPALLMFLHAWYRL